MGKLKIQGLQSFGKFKALYDVTFSVKVGEVVV